MIFICLLKLETPPLLPNAFWSYISTGSWISDFCFAENQTKYICTKRPFYACACGAALLSSLSWFVSLGFMKVWIYKYQTGVTDGTARKMTARSPPAPQIWYFSSLKHGSALFHSQYLTGSAAFLPCGGTPSSVLTPLVIQYVLASWQAGMFGLQANACLHICLISRPDCCRVRNSCMLSHYAYERAAAGLVLFAHI